MSKYIYVVMSDNENLDIQDTCILHIIQGYCVLLKRQVEASRAEGL